MVNRLSKNKDKDKIINTGIEKRQNNFAMPTVYKNLTTCIKV